MPDDDLLVRIARILDVPISSFHEARSEIDGLNELVRLWMAITCPAARREVLGVMRAMADRGTREV